MSRRPADKSAQNTQTIKSLLKLEANKNCADCKRNKHPRWASWNLGIFICIRCSGIHRGMGTHISRVKSVDLDSWTDEQLQSVMRWGNGRANLYWEAKLAPGHVPSDGKIENFIRTKYDAKRWVMDGPMPDPSTLGEAGGDDNVPLNVVQEKAKLDRSSSQRMASGPVQQSPASARKVEPLFDLMGGDEMSSPVPPVRPSTADTLSGGVRPPPAKPQNPSQLLGGLDFLGAPPERPASASSKPGGMSRPDLKQSILSLYASAPKAQPQPQHGRQGSGSFGGMQSPPVQSSGSTSSAYGGMSDAFSGLNFGSSSSAPATKPAQQSSAFSAFGQTSPPVKSMTTSPPVSSQPLSGGGFFDSGPKPPPNSAAPKSYAAPTLAARKISNASDGFGDFNTAMSNPAPPVANSHGLLDFTSTPVTIKPVVPTPAPSTSSVFNLSSNKPTPSAPKPAPSAVTANLPADPWGNNEWSAPAPAPAAAPAQTSPFAKTPATDFGWGSTPAAQPSSTANDWSSSAAATGSGWGDSNDGGFGGGFGSSAPTRPKITADEDFGGWSSSAVPEVSKPAAPSGSTGTSKGFGGDDPFTNVWE